MLIKITDQYESFINSINTNLTPLQKRFNRISSCNIKIYDCLNSEEGQVIFISRSKGDTVEVYCDSTSVQGQEYITKEVADSLIAMGFAEEMPT